MHLNLMPCNMDMSKGVVHMKKLIGFLERLEEKKIYYKLNKVRDAIMVEVAIPGERWEVEFYSGWILKVLDNSRLC